MHWKQNECKHSVCCCLFDKSNKREMRNIFKNQSSFKKTNKKHTTVFASLSIFLHSSHVKLALKISASTSMCSNAGFMLAFCPRRLFNIWAALFTFFLCRQNNFFQQRIQDFSFFSCKHRQNKKAVEFGHHKNHQKGWTKRVDEKKWCPTLLRTTPLGYFGNQLWTRHDFPRTKRRGFSRLFVSCGRRF